MLDIFHQAVAAGRIDDSWVVALLNPIPKVPGVVAVNELRPLVLQNTCLKWFTAIVALQLQDLSMAITPLHQNGCVKERFVCDHLWGALRPVGLFAICLTKEPTDVFPWAGFLTVWVSVVQLWARATKLAVAAGSQLALSSAALIALCDDGKLAHPSLDNAPPEPPTAPSKPKAAKQLSANLSLVCSVEHKIDRLLDNGSLLSTQMVRQKYTPRLVVLPGMVFILSFNFAPPSNRRPMGGREISSKESFPNLITNPFR